MRLGAINHGSGRPLEGVRVLDFGQYVAGPMAATLLADAGAEVTRIEPPGGPRFTDSGNAYSSEDFGTVVTQAPVARFTRTPAVAGDTPRIFGKGQPDGWTR